MTTPLHSKLPASRARTPQPVAPRLARCLLGSLHSPLLRILTSLTHRILTSTVPLSHTGSSLTHHGSSPLSHTRIRILSSPLSHATPRIHTLPTRRDKAKQLSQNRAAVERRYRSKFANAAESASWETVPLRRWYG